MNGGQPLEHSVDGRSLSKRTSMNFSTPSRSFIWCSQTRSTRTPADRSSQLMNVARFTFFWILARQYDRLPWGKRKQRRHPCQKQPSTKIARLFRGNQKSGWPVIDFGCNFQPSIPARTRASRSRTSVERFPLERTFPINALRASFESLSILNFSLHTK